MPTRFIQRRAALAPNDTSRGNANAIFVDSDDDQLKFTTGASGQTTVDLVTESQTQTLTNKTINLTSNTLTATSAEVLAAVTDETGTGLLVFATTPTLTTPVIGAATGTSVVLTGAISSSSATAGIGYATGAGGTATQLTSKSTGVTLNFITGEITMQAASLAADTTVAFTLTNSAIALGDYVSIQHVSAGTQASYIVTASAAAGSATVNVHNATPAALAEAIVLKYVVIKAVTA